MYRAFNLTLEPELEDAITNLGGHGRPTHLAQRHQVRAAIESLTNDNGELVASKITENWFPNIVADVFISHSHEDNDLAQVFLDSYIQYSA
jgi:hypothetical protein